MVAGGAALGWSPVNSTLRRGLCVLLPAVPIAFAALMGWQRRWMSDDGLINTRVLVNLFAGDGLVFNAGERVEVGTSTLWLALLAGVHAIFGGEYGVEAVVLGLALSIAGMVCATLGAARLHGIEGGGLLVPVGSLVFCTLAAMWDFMTSGLETGLIFGWLGATFYLLVRRLKRADEVPLWRPFAVPILIGLGPLVRPDLAILSAAFAVALITQRGSFRRRWDLARTAALAAALPVAYEVFRAGYYAALVPNTALAKGAGTGNMAVGADYLMNLVHTYRLYVPVLLVLLLALSATWTPAGRRSGPVWAAALAPVIGGLLHAGYVVYIGGDFMHARLLLPGLFALLMPCSVLRLRRPGTENVPLARWAGWLALGVWAIVAAVALRPGTLTPRMVVDEREFYLELSSSSHLMTDDELDTHTFDEAAVRAEEDLRSGLTYYTPDGTVELPVAAGFQIVVRRDTLGYFGRRAPDVFIADRLSLADPIGSRLDASAFVRAGHSQIVPDWWGVARYAAPSPRDDAQTSAARRALDCGELAELEEAVSGPLTIGRFFDNLIASPRLTTLRIPSKGTEAEDMFC